jgi:hypothetical protein
MIVRLKPDTTYHTESKIALKKKPEMTWGHLRSDYGPPEGGHYVLRCYRYVLRCYRGRGGPG